MLHDVRLQASLPSRIGPTFAPETPASCALNAPSSMESDFSPHFNAFSSEGSHSPTQNGSQQGSSSTPGGPNPKAVVACTNCRTRKIRCDGLRPNCTNCCRRKVECRFESTVRRRGRDRVPGSRKALFAEKHKADRQLPSTGQTPPPSGASRPSNLTARRRTITIPSLLIDTGSTYATPPSTSAINHDSPHYDGNPSAYSPNDWSSSVTFSPPPIPSRLPITDPRLSYLCPPRWFPPQPPARKPGTPFSLEQLLLPSAQGLTLRRPQLEQFTESSSALVEVEDDNYDQSHEARKKRRKLVHVPLNSRDSLHLSDAPGRSPSVNFMKKTWWDNLLWFYGPDRHAGARQIVVELQLAFSAWQYWTSFIHVPIFFATFHDPVARDNMQPSLLLALLAISNLMTGNELEKGHAGRTRALQLRDAAQTLLDASMNGSWIEPTLAQAAWVLMTFELCAHPLQSKARIRSAMLVFDSLVKSFSLTCMDAADQRAMIFPAGEVAVVNMVDVPPTQALVHAPNASCTCPSLCLPPSNPRAAGKTPVWLTNPGWGDTWSVAEIQREQNRKLVWCALKAYTTFMAKEAETDEGYMSFFVADPFNYCLLFPGEVQIHEIFGDSPNLGKDSIWALYSRLMLIWSSCLQMRFVGPNPLTHTPDEMASKRSKFAVQAWLAVSAIEEELKKHSCDLEQKNMYAGRDWIFSIRMSISHGFSRFTPRPETENKDLYSRDAVEQWMLRFQTTIEGVMKVLAVATPAQAGPLTRRPFLCLWLESEAERCLNLWNTDRSLTVALELAKTLLEPIEYMTWLWPCDSQRRRFIKLFHCISDTCFRAGVASPRPPGFVEKAQNMVL